MTARKIRFRHICPFLVISFLLLFLSFSHSYSHFLIKSAFSFRSILFCVFPFCFDYLYLIHSYSCTFKSITQAQMYATRNVTNRSWKAYELEEYHLLVFQIKKIKQKKKVRNKAHNVIA